MHLGARLFVALILSIAAGTTSAQVSLTDTEAMAIHDRVLTLDTHVDIGAGYGTAALDPGVFNRAQVNLPSMRVGGNVAANLFGQIEDLALGALIQSVLDEA